LPNLDILVDKVTDFNGAIVLASSCQVATYFLTFPKSEFSVSFNFLTILLQTTCADSCPVDLSNITCEVIFAVAIATKDLPHSKCHQRCLSRKKERSSDFKFRILSTHCSEKIMFNLESLLKARHKFDSFY